jgi:uncharacterized membrane protein YhaH (DUF805 family)
MFKKIFSYEGRIRRLEYGLSYLIYFAGLFIVTALLDMLKLAVDANIGLLFMALFYIPALWFMTSQAAKRCHDLGNSGWYQIIPFYVFWMLFQDGDKGRNEYGENPKTGKNSEEGVETPLDYNPEIRK